MPIEQPTGCYKPEIHYSRAFPVTEMACGKLGPSTHVPEYVNCERCRFVLGWLAAEEVVPLPARIGQVELKAAREVFFMEPRATECRNAATWRSRAAIVVGGSVYIGIFIASPEVGIIR